MNFSALVHKLPEWRKRMEFARRPAPDGWTWYGYDILSNLEHLAEIVSEPTQAKLALNSRMRIADIGCADGDLGFMLAAEGHHVDLLDWPQTNWNGCRGVDLLRSRLRLDVELHHVDLDSQFVLPKQSYDFVFLLGILYHLKNPYYVLETLATRTQYCAISTRVARFLPYTAQQRGWFGFGSQAGKASEIEVTEVPLAYLLDADECNNDATNFWIFSAAGLRRLVRRCGWEILDEGFMGSECSHPSALDRDQRAVMVLESRRLVS